MKNNKFVLKKLNINLFWSYAIIILLSVLTIGIQMVFQNWKNAYGYLSAFSNPVILLLNWLPVFLLYIFIFGITNSVAVSFTLPNSIIMIFLLVNEYKIIFRDEPLFFTDLTLAGETADIMQNYTLVFPFKVILFPLIIIIISVLLFLFIRSNKTKWYIRTAISSVSLVVFVILMTTVYSDYSYYHNLKIKGNEFRASEEYAHKGFTYSFIASVSGTRYPKPEGYSTSNVTAVLNEYTPKENEEYPDVIAIMSEAFFDIQPASELNFLPGMNPLEKFNKIRNNSMFGSIFVPGFAGATSQTEFEFLTGTNISLVSGSLPVMYNTHIKSSAYSLAFAFKEKGFRTIATHPGHDWFYNRRNVYTYMGFDETVFIEDFKGEVDYVNYYASDKVASEMILDNYRKHLEEYPEKGYFNFNVTIQNHGPYPSKAPEITRIARPEGMTDEEFNILCHYLNNLSDASELLYEVTEFANSLDRPVVVVFFGDHLPYLDAELNIYKTIGYSLISDGSNDSEAYIKQHLTPYIIWGNNSFYKTHKKTLPKYSGIISSNFLVGKLTEFMDIDLSPYFMFIKDISKEIQIISAKINVIKGTEYNDFPKEYEDSIRKYRILQYYNLKEYKRPAK